MHNFSVEVRAGESLEQALRRFSSKVNRTGILKIVKKKRFYVKPSVQKKISLAKSIRRHLKLARAAEGKGPVKGAAKGADKRPTRGPGRG